MKIAIIGYGRMGQVISRIAKGRGHNVISIDPKKDEADFKEINKGSLNGVDVCIDFTHPHCIIENIHAVSKLGKSLVAVTTGWYDKLEDVKKVVAGIGFIYSSNFSIGVNVFFEIVKNAAKIMDKFESYDIGGMEYHHNKKADSPSGTAITIAEILRDNIGRKKEIVYDIVDRQIKSNELHFASARIGSIPGTHTVIFDSNADTIELTHKARNREGFALGSVLAVEWLNNKKGVFTINDFLKEIVEK